MGMSDFQMEAERKRLADLIEADKMRYFGAGNYGNEDARLSQYPAPEVKQTLGSLFSQQDPSIYDSNRSLSVSYVDPNQQEQQPAPLPEGNWTNKVVDNQTGRVQYLQSAPEQQGLNRSANQVEIPGYGKGYYLKGDSMRAVMRDGTIVDLGRDTGAERARNKENLAMDKVRADIAHTQSLTDASRVKPDLMSKIMSEIEGAELKALIPGTAEYERVSKETAERDASDMRRDNAVTSAIGVLDNINNAKKKVGWASTGLVGQGLRNFGGTDALSLNEALEPVRSSLSFDRLQRMREESKTGGALGQVAVQELNMLQKSMASLDTAQNQEDLNRSLNVVQKHYENYVSAMQKARSSGEFSGEQKSNAQIQGERQFAEAKGLPPEGAVRRIR